MHLQLQINGSARYTDTTALYDYGYENYSINTIAKQNDVIQQIEVANASKDTRDLDLIIENDLNVLVKQNTQISEPTITLNEVIKAPISQNAVLGTITYTINGIDYTQNLLSSHNVEPNDFLLIIFKTLLSIVILMIITVFLLSNSKKSKKKKKRKSKYSIRY